MDLFPETLPPDEKPKKAQNSVPLALRLSPKDLSGFYGQEHLLSPGKLLRRAIEFDRLGSVIFFGPSGTGKSALARLIAARTQAHFVELNAVTVGVAELRKEIEAAKMRQENRGKKTILLVDEIHHFNRSQQDALLPDVERGTITLIGITSENPFFYVNPALRSRSQIFEFFPLSTKDLEKILDRALKNSETGLGSLPVQMTPEAQEHLVIMSNGDARRLLNALEIGAYTTPKDKDGKIHFTLKVAEESLQKKALQYDKKSDEHYDTISAFIKSMRGGDPDAALYWMAKMLEAGEDPRFVARRILICAAEDVGNADPQALVISAAAFQAVQLVGMPEGRIPLAQAATYVACAPKSNAAYLGIEQALAELRKGKSRSVPMHLRDANMDRESRGHGRGYKYPHDYPGHWVEQLYMPDPKTFYIPTDEGEEKTIKERLKQWKKH